MSLLCLQNLNLKVIPEDVFKNANLKHIKLTPGNNIEVSEKYKLMDILKNLETVDDRDITVQRNAIKNLNAIFQRRLQEMFLTKQASEIYCEPAEEKVRIQKMITLAQSTILAGPSALSNYRNYKLERLIEENYELFVSDALELKELKESEKELTPLKRIGRQQQTLQSLKRKRFSSPLVNKKPRRSATTHSVHHLLQTHSKNNDPEDFQTKVWMCAFQPDINDPTKTTNLVATCGGDSICFIDCDSGIVLKKYKQTNEEFYCLCWTILKYKDELKGEESTLAALAVAGISGDIKLIDPDNLICFERVSYHRKPVDALMFHPIIQHWLFSGSEDRTVVLWDLGYPFSSDVRKAEKKLVLKGSLQSTLRNLTFAPHGKVILGATDDGLHVWNVDFVGVSNKDHVRSAMYTYRLPSKISQAIDSLNILNNNLFAMKRLGEGVIQIIYSKSEFLQNDLQLVTSLSWRKTSTAFLKFNFTKGCSTLLAGDDEGTIWMYNLKELMLKSHDDMDNDAKALVENLQPIKAEKLRCENKYGRLFNHVCSSSNLDHVVGVTDANVVAIWNR
ncbi:leucine-rich repeat and WD repeat-containing protein 1-like [Clytia hemisphaerica]